MTSGTDTKSPRAKAASYSRPRALTDHPTHYCPGCGHGIVHRLLAEVIEERGIRGRTIAIAPVGCAVLAYDYLDVDMSEAAHGRAPAVATGIKRSLPDRVVISYQGDGDLAAIGTAEIIHAANRGENITVLFVNNGIYGMTNGQLAPTTPVGMRTATTPRGRSPERLEGYPIRVCELLNQLQAVAYLERTSVSGPGRVRGVKKAIHHALDTQEQNRGFSLVEILSPCPTYWRKPPGAAMDWIETEMMKIFPLGVYRDWTET